MVQIYLLFTAYAALFAIHVIPAWGGQNEKRTGLLSRDITDAAKGLAILGIFLSHIATHVTVEPQAVYEKVISYGMSFLGTAGVGVFFALSGWGNVHALERCLSGKDRLAWLGRRLKKIYVTLVVNNAVVMAVLYLAYGERVSLRAAVVDILTLSVPFAATWYLKVQVLMYLFLLVSAPVSAYVAEFITKSVAGNAPGNIPGVAAGTVSKSALEDARQKRCQAAVVAVFCVGYIAAARGFGLPAHWWNMVLCFPLGILAAGYQEKMQKATSKKSALFLFLAAYLALYLLCILTGGMQAVVCTLLTASALCFFQAADASRKIFCIAGAYSFELYLVHIGLVDVAFAHGTPWVGVIQFTTLSIVGTFLVHHVVAGVTGLERV